MTRSQSRILVQVECLLTQLLFEHSLRIRLKAETGDSGKKEDGESDSAATRESTSIAGTQEASEAETLTDSQGTTESTIAPTGRENAKSTKEESSSNAQNLIGKINNLITSDLGNITGARDLLFVFLYIPFELILCMLFLYAILGWRYESKFPCSVALTILTNSALVGLAVMIACLPLPGYIARLTQDVQVARMKKTDARVQSVSESASLQFLLRRSNNTDGLIPLAMNILRMAKLFGWEGKMHDRIREKREEELSFIWKRQIFGVTNEVIK
jgi:ABC transporter transmembrane region